MLLPATEAAQIVSQIARALDQAHAEGVAHRDLKPGNVFLTRNEEDNLLVKLLDFGIARPIHARRLAGAFSTDKGFVVGTPGYMGPEQTRASPKLDHRCDLWSLATIGYQMLSGHLPVDGDDTDEIMKNVCAGRIVSILQRDPRLPESLDPFFARAFADRVDDRFESASQLAQAFERACLASPAASSLDTTSTPDSVSTGIEFSSTLATHEVPGGPQRARTRLVLASVGAVTLLAAIGGIWHGLASPRDGAVSPNLLGPSLDESATVARLAPSATGESLPRAASWVPVPAPPAFPSAPTRLAPAPPRANSDRAQSAAPSPPVRSLDAPDAAVPRPARAPSRPSEDRNDVF